MNPFIGYGLGLLGLFLGGILSELQIARHDRRIERLEQEVAKLRRWWLNR